jgi:hypothetical protein
MTFYLGLAASLRLFACWLMSSATDTNFWEVSHCSSVSLTSLAQAWTGWLSSTHIQHEQHKRGNNEVECPFCVARAVYVRACTPHLHCAVAFKKRTVA